MFWPFRDKNRELLEAIYRDSRLLIAGVERIENDLFTIGKLLEEGMTPLEQRAVARRLQAISKRLRRIAKP